MNNQGFFVKNKDESYSGPFITLNEARSQGFDLLIYHGTLLVNEDGTFDDINLFLVPKLK
jgi:hypothetical protein